MSTQAILERLKMNAFTPLPFLSHGRAQTLGGYYFPYNPFLDHSCQHTIELADGDKVVIIENKPSVLRDNGRIVLLVHGLTGSHRSKYVIRVTRRLLEDGYHVFRMNLRGCGAGQGLAKHLYHSGRSEDTRAVIHWLQQHYPNQPVTQVGFSLGANITLKMAGEDAGQSPGLLDSIVAISPPLCLSTSVKLIIKEHNALFNQYFMEGLYRDAGLLNRAQPAHFNRLKNVHEFDTQYTAPRSGFKSAEDYYAQCSSKHFIDAVTLPTLLLYSTDDPVITRRPFLKLIPKPQQDFIITSAGGHVGWIGHTEPRFGFRWMDKLIVKWINTLD